MYANALVGAMSASSLYYPSSLHGVTRTMPECEPVFQALRACAKKEKAEFLPGFFKAQPGGYGEGDQFLGVVVPDQRRIARQFRDIELTDIEKLLKSRWHECRLTGLLILVDQYARSSKPKSADADQQKELVRFYLDHTEGVNNWDLVDSSAHKILGHWLLSNPAERHVLDSLANSKNMWEQRIAIIATLPLTQAAEFAYLRKLAIALLDHPHDLMHKAIGWMLREMGKKDIDELRAFLADHHQQMPRTMLRYSIEKLPPAERKRWMKKEL